MRRYSLIIILAILLTACTAVGTQSSGSFSATATQPASSNLSGGYLHVYSNAVEFFQLTNNNGQISGQEQEAYVTTNDPYNMKNGSSVVSGTFNGSSVTLTFSIYGFPVKSYAGTYDGTNLVLTVPDSNGGLSNILNIAQHPPMIIIMPYPTSNLRYNQNIKLLPMPRLLL